MFTVLSVLVSNGYPFSFLQKLTKTGKPNKSAEPADEFKATTVLPYVKGLSEQLCHCLQQHGVRADVKSETTLRSQLVRSKDFLDTAKQDGVVCRIPYECGDVYIGETGDLCKTELRSTIETFDSPVPRPPPFQSMPTTPDTSHSGTK